VFFWINSCDGEFCEPGIGRQVGDNFYSEWVLYELDRALVLGILKLISLLILGP
jgi:hypothetical protein